MSHKNSYTSHRQPPQNSIRTRTSTQTQTVTKMMRPWNNSSAVCKSWGKRSSSSRQPKCLKNTNTTSWMWAHPPKYQIKKEQITEWGRIWKRESSISPAQRRFRHNRLPTQIAIICTGKPGKGFKEALILSKRQVWRCWKDSRRSRGTQLQSRRKKSSHLRYVRISKLSRGKQLWKELAPLKG